jgi:3-isopropylmalate/(R)-2-methylmalate dehydratase large subunit
MSTVTQKIISAHAGLEYVNPGEIVKAEVDKALMPALTGVLAFKAMEDMGVKNVWDTEKVILILDHIAPATNIVNSTLHKESRRLAKENNLKYFYDINSGVCHQVFPEKGHVSPGMLLVGSDSHTCTHGAFGAFATGIGSTDMGAVLATGKLWFKVPETINVMVEGRLKEPVAPKDVILKVAGEIGADGATYNAIEFRGETIEEMSMGGRMTLCNMAIEMGGKTGIVEADETTQRYLKDRTSNPYNLVRSDPDAEYKETLEIDAEGLEPMVSKPHSVDNVAPVSTLADIEVDQVFIGSCTNGRIEDLTIAAKILKGNQIAKSTRLIVTPASFEVYREANRRGIIDTLMWAGGTVCNPSCGACFGGNNGILAPGEVGLTTSNRNFKGRQGSPEAYVYLSSPATAAASALTGRITDPREVMS